MSSSRRLSLDHQALRENRRSTAYHVIHGYLEIDRVVRELFPVDPSKRLILLTVMAANVQRLVQDPSIPAPDKSSRRMQPDQIMAISRRTIAAATGLPRETVRRQVAEMLEDELLLAREDGLLINLLLSEPHAVAGTTAAAEAMVAMAQQLMHLGVLRLGNAPANEAAPRAAR